MQIPTHDSLVLPLCYKKKEKLHRSDPQLYSQNLLFPKDGFIICKILLRFKDLISIVSQFSTVDFTKIAGFYMTLAYNFKFLHIHCSYWFTVGRHKDMGILKPIFIALFQMRWAIGKLIFKISSAEIRNNRH